MCLETNSQPLVSELRRSCRPHSHGSVCPHLYWKMDRKQLQRGPEEQRLTWLFNEHILRPRMGFQSRPRRCSDCVASIRRRSSKSGAARRRHRNPNERSIPRTRAFKGSPNADMSGRTMKTICKHLEEEEEPFSPESQSRLCSGGVHREPRVAHLKNKCEADSLDTRREQRPARLQPASSLDNETTTRGVLDTLFSLKHLPSMKT